MELKEEPSTSFPAATHQVAAGASNGKSRPSLFRRRKRREHNTGGPAPYVLVLPSLAIIILVLGVPLYLMGKFALSKYTVFQFFTGGAQYIGLKNFDTLVHDPLFWKATYRNVFFMVGCVFFTVLPGLLIALLFTKISNWARLILTTGLVFAWSMPALVYVNIFEFTTDRNFGVFNYIFYKLGIQHDLVHKWTDSTWQGYGLFIGMIAWVSIPFVAITLYAALSQVPQELLEAATVDGASGWRSFWAITLPVLKPALVIVTTLSVIWDFTIFVQIYAFFFGGAIPDVFQILPIYVYQLAFGKGDYGLGAAASTMFILFMIPIAIFYTRQQLRQQSDFA
jgi:N,N'-diacetylchitobiose transport system permease protein